MKSLLVTILLFASNAIFSQHTIETDPYLFAWHYVGDENFAFGGITVTPGDIALDFGPLEQPFIAFSDYNHDGKISVMKYEGGQWIYVGEPGFSSGRSDYIRIGFTSLGEPIVAFSDNGFNCNPKVMGYDGTTWINIGDLGMPNTCATFPTLAIDENDQVYFAYSDENNGGKATVKRFDGVQWQNIGNPCFTAGDAWYLSLAFNNSNELFIGFEDYSLNGKASVMHYNGNEWVFLGDSGFSVSYVWDVNLRFNQADQMFYIAFTDFDLAHYNKATVMRFSGTSWDSVGSPGFSPGWVDYLSFDISSAGKLYVGFGDVANGYKATVITYNDPEWELVGPAGFSSGTEIWLNDLNVSPSGIPFFAFQDEAINSGNLYTNVVKYDSVFDGISEYSKEISVYPNPAVTEIAFTFSGNIDNNTKLEILDLNGKRVFKGVITSTRSIISIGDFPPGIYIYMITVDQCVYRGIFSKI